MKDKKTYVFCEYCDTPIEDCSPPNDKSYKKGVIYIEQHSSILLNNTNNKDNHSSDISGIYCNINCLIKHLRKLRRNKSSNKIIELNVS